LLIYRTLTVTNFLIIIGMNRWSFVAFTTE